MYNFGDSKDYLKQYDENYRSLDYTGTQAQPGTRSLGEEAAKRWDEKQKWERDYKTFSSAPSASASVLGSSGSAGGGPQSHQAGPAQGLVAAQLQTGFAAVDPLAYMRAFM